MTTMNDLLERGLIPEPLIRLGIRRLLGRRLAEEEARHPEHAEAWVEVMARSPIAEVPDLANAQHYEVPVDLFRRVLGRHLKYSSAYWSEGVASLDEAEATMLSLTCQRAQLAGGQEILELGCGWGSLTLWMAERYPRSRIVAVSNSSSQRRFILAEAERRSLDNVEVITRDMNDFDTHRTFDRIVSVEMFEHIRNWSKLLSRARRWLRDDGRLFLHVFAHRRFVYPYETSGPDDWMGRTFFTGGMMPSFDLVDRIEKPFDVIDRWQVGGEHYAKTSEAWLQNLKDARREVIETFTRDLGPDEARRQYERWKVFFLACAESFGLRSGTEWLVAHYLLRPRAGGAS